MASRLSSMKEEAKMQWGRLSEGGDPSTLIESRIFPIEFDDSSVAKIP